MLAVKVFEKLLVDLKELLEEVVVKDVGKIDVLRNVVALSKKLGSLAEAQNGLKKHPQEIQMVVLGFVDIGQMNLGLAHVKQERAQRT